MTRIEKLDVDGFKGLTDTSLEFGGINVITGRNNTGKTSVLEAIELGLDPERLLGFGDQLDNIINVRSEESNIDLSLSDDQTSFSLRVAPSEEAIGHAIDALARLFSYQYFSSDTKYEKISEEIERIIKRELAEVDETPNINNNVIYIKYCSEGFWLSHIDKNLKQLVWSRKNEIETSLKSEIDKEDWEEYSPFNDVEDYWHKVELYTPHSYFQFYPDRPEGPNEVLFIDQPKIGDALDPDDEEGAAIKKVEIRDYLNDHEITPEPGVTVEDFDFDVLVFEEDGERYEVPYDFMGDGFKTIVGILWQFVGEDDVSDVVLMEEPENNMHPGYVSELVPFLVEVAREEDVQLFITTHNVDFISEFFTELPDEQQEYLESEFRLIQMTETVPKTFDYADAREQVEDLHLDLRGI